MVRAFFNEKAAIWDATIAEKDIAKLEALCQRLDIKPGASVLDVGTGTGIFVPFLLNKIKANGRLVAVDIAEEMLKLSRAKAFPGNIDYVHADVTSLPIDAERFDAAVCYSSFPHFHHKLKALSELARVLKRGGGLFICHTSSRAAVNMIHSGMPAVSNDLIPDANEMVTLLSAAGFGNARIEDEVHSYLASAAKL